MRSHAIRTLLISVAAIGGALVWGAVELLALQWTRITKRRQMAEVINAS